jgi:DNA-binding MarR family transcriptional regulator
VLEPHRSLDRSTPGEGQLGSVRLGLTRLGRLLSSRRVHAGMAAAAGVTLPQQAMDVLRALGDREALPVGDLARAARMDTGAVSRQVRVLQTAGLVERRPSPQHGSIVLVEATEQGRATAHRFEEVRNAQLSRALADWTDEERAELGRLLLRLVDDLQRTPYQRADREA